MRASALLLFRAATGKAGTVLRMVSEAKTGYAFYLRMHLPSANTKVQLMHYDPLVNTHVLFSSTRAGVSGGGVRPKRKVAKRYSPPVGVKESKAHRVGRT